MTENGPDEKVTQAVVETVEHAIRIHQKALTLMDSVKESLQVAASLAGEQGENMHYATYFDLAVRLKEAKIPNRGVFTGNKSLGPPPGTIVRKERGSADPWPGAAPCVYILMQGSEVIYVGKTANVSARMAAHSSKPWTWAEVVICASDSDAATLEGDLIFQHQPPLNRAGRWERPRTAAPTDHVDHDVKEYPNAIAFREEWDRWRFDGMAAPLPTDAELDKSLAAWIFKGHLNLAEIVDLMPNALDRDGIAVEDRFRYFCGVAWRHIRERT